MGRIFILLAFAVLAAHCREILLLRGNTAEQKRYAAALEKSLKKNGIKYDIFDEKSLASKHLNGISLLILPHNGPLSNETSKVIADFSENGGKLLAFYTEDKTVTDLLGISSVKYHKTGGKTGYAEFANKLEKFSCFPDRAYYSPGSIMIPKLKSGTIALASWKRASGESLNITAAAYNKNGIYFTSVYPLRHSEGMEDFIICAISMTKPEVMKKYCASIGTKACSFAGNDTFGIVEKRIAASGKNNFYPQLQKAKKLMEEGRARESTGNYGKAINAYRKADRLAGDIYVSTASSRPAEMRGVWCHSAYGISGMTWDEIAERLAANGFNALFLNACWADLADYDSDVLEVAPDVAAKGDQIKKCLEACRKHGLQLHIWRVCWNLGHRYPPEKLKKMQQAKRTQISKTGSDSAFLTPHLKENLELELAAISEIAEKYQVDGIHLDYIRYSGSRFDYSDGARTAFEKHLGRRVAKWPEDCSAGGVDFQAFCKWRCSNISVLAERASMEIKARNPAMKLSVAVYPEWNNSPEWIGQDVCQWIDKGWIDFICPMNYSTDMRRYKMWLKAQSKYISGRVPVYSGIALYMLEHDPLKALLQVEEAARQGFDGYICFDLKNAFMERCMPSFGKALNKYSAAVLPHDSRTLAFKAAPGDEDIDGRYRVNGVIKAYADIPEHLRNQSMKVSIEIDGRNWGGKGVSARFTNTGLEITLNTFTPGGYRIRLENGPFMARSSVFSVLSNEEAREVVLRKGPPRFKNNGGIRVAVWDDDAFGAAPIIAALSSDPGYDVAVLHNTKAENLKNCQVIILPQMRMGEKHFKDKATADIFRKYVRDGGGLLVTHALVGTRSYPILFPDIVKTVNQVALQENVWHISKDEILSGVPAGKNTSAAKDMIEMTPGRKGRKLTLSESGKCTTVAGKVKKGRFTACGMGLGIDGNDEDTPLTAAEKNLLFKIVHWLANE